MSSRSQRLDDLEKTVKEYVDSERTRLQNEAKVLQAVLDGRTGGRGVQRIGNNIVAGIANADLADFLKEN